jgi:hypothetical protein
MFTVRLQFVLGIEKRIPIIKCARYIDTVVFEFGFLRNNKSNVELPPRNGGRTY